MEPRAQLLARKPLSPAALALQPQRPLVQLDERAVVEAAAQALDVPAEALVEEGRRGAVVCRRKGPRDIGNLYGGRYGGEIWGRYGGDMGEVGGGNRHLQRLKESQPLRRDHRKAVKESRRGLADRREGPRERGELLRLELGQPRRRFGGESRKQRRGRSSGGCKRPRGVGQPLRCEELPHQHRQPRGEAVEERRRLITAAAVK